MNSQSLIVLLHTTIHLTLTLLLQPLNALGFLLGILLTFIPPLSMSILRQNRLGSQDTELLTTQPVKR